MRSSVHNAPAICLGGFVYLALINFNNAGPLRARPPVIKRRPPSPPPPRKRTCAASRRGIIGPFSPGTARIPKPFAVSPACGIYDDVRGEGAAVARSVVNSRLNYERDKRSRRSLGSSSFFCCKRGVDSAQSHPDAFVFRSSSLFTAHLLRNCFRNAE